MSVNDWLPNDCDLLLKRKPTMTSDDILKVLTWAAANNVKRIEYARDGVIVDFFQVPQASTDAPQTEFSGIGKALDAELAKHRAMEAQQPERKRETDIDVVMNPGKDILFPPDNEP